MIISSLDNKKIKLINSLKIAKNRRELGLFVIEGMHLVKEAYQNNCLQEVYLLENQQLEFTFDLPINYVTIEVMKKITSLKTPSNILGICKIQNGLKPLGNRLLILDGIQDPGNLGTIIRSASAFSVDTIILSPTCVDLYNEKVIRSTQGMFLKMNFLVEDLITVIPKLKREGYMILGTDVKNGVNVKTIKTLKYALIMGNEGNGVREEIKKMCDQNLYIKMNSACESLNVAIATSILLYELGALDE